MTDRSGEHQAPWARDPNAVWSKDENGAVKLDPMAFFADYMVTAIPNRVRRIDELHRLFQEMRWQRHLLYPTEADDTRVLQFIALLERVLALPAGEYIELGTLHGGTARMIWKCLAPAARLFCFDTWTGFVAEDLAAESDDAWDRIVFPSPELLDVRELVTGTRAEDASLVLVPGHVPGSLAAYDDLRFRFAHLDMDLWQPTAAAVQWLWPRMVPGGILVFHDYGISAGVKRAVDEFFLPLLVPLPMGDRYGSVMLFKPGVSS